MAKFQIVNSHSKDVAFEAEAESVSTEGKSFVFLNQEQQVVATWPAENDSLPGTIRASADDDSSVSSAFHIVRL